MTDQSIAGIFETPEHAQAALADLRGAGVPERAIGVHGATAADGSTSQRGPEYWTAHLVGASQHGTSVYDRCVQEGDTVVTVQAPAAQAARVMDILERHGAADPEERATRYGMAAAAVAAAAETLQLAEEQLQVGTRVVERGGTRVRRYVVETPVERSVSLHDETVTIERHPVSNGRVAADSFTDRTLELTATAEEAVVSKTARVYEEVGLHREATERVETVRDTLRKEQVAVEQVPADTVQSATRPRPARI